MADSAITSATFAAVTLADLGITSTAAELNLLDGVTASTAELNYIDGVTSDIQTQLNAKSPIADPTFTGTINAPAGSTSKAPIKIATGGSLLTTPEDGALEMDADCFYGTTDGGNRGYIPVVHFIRQDATYTLANSGTAQKLFNSSTNGEITLETGTYRFEALVSLTGMSATSGNATFSLAGTATLGGILWFGYGRDIAADGTTGTLSGSYSRDATLVTAPLLTAATATEMYAFLKGTFEVTAGGTLIPSITLQTAVGTAVVAIGSYFEVYRVGGTSSTTVGQWS